MKIRSWHLFLQLSFSNPSPHQHRSLLYTPSCIHLHNPILIKLDVPRIKVVTRDAESTWIYRAENFPRMAEILTEKCSKLVKDN